MRKALIVIGILALVAIVVAVFVLPAMDREAMKGPLIDATDAVLAGSVERLRECFTADAQFDTGMGLTLPMHEVLAYIAPQLTSHEFQGGNARFKGFENQRSTGRGRAEADFVVVTGYAGDETGGHRVPVQVRGHVELTRLGFMRWRISRLSADDTIVQTLAPGLRRKLTPSDGTTGR
jgi:hypothetical protein